ncbi:SMI1/KNR4 family protein [Streptomyces asoensis]
MNDALAQIKEVVSFLSEGGLVGNMVDWKCEAAALGLASFPGDYQEFISTFGAGSFEDALFVSIPRSGTPAAPLTVGPLPDLEAMDDWQDSDAQARYPLANMLVWGQTNSADALCWVTTDSDPNRWPVAVWARQDGGWAVYECGMVEFLVRVLRADFTSCPLSSTTLWGRGSARFLNFRDEERLLDEGVDPWTGESMDPFADL